jgi:hypothetical protein
MLGRVSMSQSKQGVPDKVVRAMLAVRAADRVGIYSRAAVINEMDALGFIVEAHWLRQNPWMFAEALIRFFEALPQFLKEREEARSGE